MSLSALDIAVLAREVDAECRGGAVQRIYDGRAGEVLLGLRRPGRTRWVLLAAGSKWARLHLSSGRGARQERPSAFVALLRKHLLGARLTGCGAVAGDRVAQLAFRRGPGPAPDSTLMAELTGRHGNLFLVDRDGVILGSLRANVSHRRKLVAGEPYVLPSPPPGGVPVRPAALPADAAGAASREVEREVEAALLAESVDRARTELARDLRKAIKRLTRRLQHLEQDRGRADRADQLRRWGELLQSAYGQVERGAREVEVTDYYDPDLGPVKIPLDPSRDLRENIAHYFKESRRMGNARERIEARRAKTQTSLEVARALQAELKEEAGDQERGERRPGQRLEAIETLRERASEAGLLRRSEQARRGVSAERPVAQPYRRFVSQTGAEILVGKGAKDNDRLTFRVARGRDLWLHVDGAAGSHVIVRLEKGQDPDAETLVDAATLAAFYSKRRKERTVDVRYTRQKYLRKPRGAAPGRVSVSQSKTIGVRVEEVRLQRLFETRPES